MQETAALITAAEIQREAVLETLRASGGDRLETASREIRGVEQRLTDVERARERLDRALADIGATVSTGEDFAALVDTAHRALADSGARRTAQKEFAEATSESKDAERDLAGLRAEHSAVKARRGNIPTDLHTARGLLADAAGSPRTTCRSSVN